MRKKEWYMDYATHAFSRYANLGQPTRDDYENIIRERVQQENVLLDPEFVSIKEEDCR